jgi:hypothetical protein
MEKRLEGSDRGDKPPVAWSMDEVLNLVGFDVVGLPG